MIAQGFAVSETDAKNLFLLLHVVHPGPAMGTEGNFGVSSPTSKSPRMEIQQPVNTSFKATSLPQ